MRQVVFLEYLHRHITCCEALLCCGMSMDELELKGSS